MNLKKIIRKDADGNSMSFEFDIPKANVPPVDSIPEYDHPGDPRGSDTVPAWLTPGENIVNAEASRIPGNQQIIDQMNNQGRAIQAQQGGSIPTYADGGGLIDIARTATEYAPYMLAGINSLALPAGLWGLYKSNRDGKRRAAMRSEGGVVYAEEGTQPAADTSWVDGILDALRFVESGEITDPSKLISDAGAEGFYQIMPANFGELTGKNDAGEIVTYKGKGAAGYNTPVISREDAYNPEKARAWAKAYLTNMQLAHPEWSPADVLRAYNWGPGNMKEFMKEGIRWDEVPAEAKNYTDKVFKHYKKLTGEDFYDTTSNAPELLGLHNSIPVPDDMIIPSGDDLSMVGYDFPELKNDTSVEIDADGPGQNLAIGPGGVPSMPTNFMGSVNPRKGYESSEDYMNTYGIVDPLSGRLRPPRYEGGAIMPGMEDLYQQYPIDLTPDHWPTMEEIVKGPGIPPQAEVDPTGFMERRVAENEALANRQVMLDNMDQEMELQKILEKAERGEYGPFPGASIDGDEFAKAAGAVGLPTDNDTLNKIVDMVNRENISPQEAAAKIKEIEGREDFIKGPGVPPQAEVDPTGRMEREVENNIASANKEFSFTPMVDQMIDYSDPYGEFGAPPALTPVTQDYAPIPNQMIDYSDTYNNEQFMRESGFAGAGDHIRSWWNKIAPEFWLGDADISVSELIFSPESALEKINTHKEKLNQEKISKEAFDKHQEELVETFKTNKVDEVSNKLDNGENVSQSSAEVEAKYKEIFEEGRGNKKLHEDLKLPQENQVKGFFEGLLGDIFDTKELKRAAVMYLGGRLLGYSHSTAGNFAVKNMLNRMQTQEANRAANIKEWAGKYTPASLDLYKNSGNLSDLIPVGAKMFRQGTFQDFHGMVNGRQVTVKAEKVHVGTGDSKQVKWMLPNGQLLDTSKMSLNAYDVPKTEEYENRVLKHRKDINSQLTALRNQIGKRGSGENIDYATNINVDTASGVSVEWALANGVDLVRLPGLVDLAYKAMVNDTGRTDGKPSDIEGYLNDIIIKQSTNEDKLFKTEEGTPMSAELFQIMTQNIEHILTSQGQQSDFTGISNYINVASQVWSGTNELKDGTPDPDNLTQADRDKWNSKSSSGKGADTTGFYEWLQSELAKEMG